MIPSSGEEFDDAAMGQRSRETDDVLQRQVPRQFPLGKPRQDLHEVNEALCPVIIKITPGAAFAVGLAGRRKPPEFRTSGSKLPGADPFQVDLPDRMVRKVAAVARESHGVLVQRSRHLDIPSGYRSGKPADSAE
jgi:hypothetical protein